MSQLRSGTLSINQSGIAGFSAKVSQIGELPPAPRSKIFNPDFVADQFTADCTGSAVCTADFSGVQLITASLAGSASVSASFDGVKLVGAALTGSASVSGNFGGVQLVSGALSGSASITASLNGVKLVSCSIVGLTGCAATFEGSLPPIPPIPPEPPVPPPLWGGGDSISFKKERKVEKKQRIPKKHERIPVLEKRIPKIKQRIPNPDYWISEPAPRVIPTLPQAQERPSLPHSPRVQPRFVQTQPGIGRDVMDALMAVMAVDGVRDAKSPELKAQSIDDDLELILLVDSLSD